MFRRFFDEGHAQNSYLLMAMSRREVRGFVGVAPAGAAPWRTLEFSPT